MTLPDMYINRSVAAVEMFLHPAQGALDNAYKGDISSMGAAIVQAGVLTTLKFYEIRPSSSDETNAHARRNRVTEALAYILTGNPRPGLLSDWYNGESDKRAAGSRLINAAIALKLAIRCYDQKETEAS